MYAKMLIGKKIKIAESRDKTLLGVSGQIVDETRNTLVVQTATSRKKIPKSIVTIQLDAADKSFRLQGSDLIGTPQERIYKY
jgi:ribonuclease P protein subunit POP4